MPRPFLKIDTVMLEEQAGDFALKDNLAGLRQVESELRFRKTERARRLLIEVLTWAQELERKLTQARMLELEARLREAHSQGERPKTAANGKGLYQKVGLDPDCPDFVLKAARRAFRKEHHPDGRSAVEGPGAARRFQEIDAIFDELEQSRKN
jgi:hypothetical protein